MNSDKLPDACLDEVTIPGVFGTVAAPEGRRLGGKDEFDSGELTCLGEARALSATQHLHPDPTLGAIPVFGPEFPAVRGMICKLEARA